MEYIYTYQFFPVGQGLFGAGCIHRNDTQSKLLFQWVYDCGTVSTQRFIDRGIDLIDSWHQAKTPVDLVALSHFDRDHISGVCRLISQHHIRTLLLPYLPLWKRILIAFEEEISVRSPLMQFFLNPALYLLQREGARIDRILFVLPSDDAGPPLDERPAKPFDGPDPWKLDFTPGEPDDPTEAELLRAQTEDTIIHFLPSGEAIHILGLWEFIPYNDDTPHPVSDPFQISVTQKRTALLEAPTEKQRAIALKDLKKAYDHHFGSTAKNRNEISLFLYGGPVYASWKTTILGGIPSMHLCNCCAWGFGSPSLRENHLRCSVLYSGDGYLDTPQKLNRLVRYINIERVRRVGAFQIMHHGARTNWHLGVAAQIQPVISVISSDPKRQPHHPHAEVTNEFRQYGLLKINKRWGVNATGWMRPSLP